MQPGTGGSLSGTATYLKRMNPGLKVVLSDPEGSGLYNRVKYGVMFDVKEKEGRKRR
jgi:cysteine synthase A